MPRAKKKITLGDIPSKISRVTSQQLLYTVLLVSFFLIGYLVARVQSLEEQRGGSVVAGVQTQPDTTAPTTPPAKVDVELGHLPPLGDPDAPVKIVEFSDLQCPFCRRFVIDTQPQIVQDYIDSGKAVLYFRHYPLSFHPQAQITGEAAECANDQKMFWEFHDKIYEEQDKKGQGTIEYTTDDLKQWAVDIGLDSATFNQCLDSGTHKTVVEKDLADGTTAGVDGTPGFFINGTPLVGAMPFESFKAVIEEELNK